MASSSKKLLHNRTVEGVLSVGAVLAERPRTAYKRARMELTTILPLAAVAAGIMSLLVLLQTSQLAAHGTTLRTLEVERESLRQSNVHLQAEIAALQSLRRIETLAVEELGMVPAEERKYIVVDVESTGSEIPADRPPTFDRERDLQFARSTWFEQLLGLLPWVGE